jgi:Na+/proline symporter
MLLMQLFMAVTSTGSAEVIAVSSILTYDLYWTYLNPELKDKVRFAAVCVPVCAVCARCAYQILYAHRLFSKSDGILYR